MFSTILSVTTWVVPTVVLLVVAIFLAVLFRTVVRTNMVHIVQSRRKTTSYGTGQAGSNVYYKWPSWVPYFGVTVIVLPVSNFDLPLKDYEAYDIDRVPFKVDVVSFFRIVDTALAAQRVASLEQLKEQLAQIVQGAVRKVLASDVIDKIMVERAQFGDLFTKEVGEQLKEWGVESVKSMELMDIRDGKEGNAVSNIMAKKISNIEKESRIEVANNLQAAKVAEINAEQTVKVRQQEADQVVGQRTAEKDREVGIAQQKSSQAVLVEKKETATKDMDVRQVEQVRTAEIEKQKQIVAAEQTKQTTILEAEGVMESQKRKAEGVETYGKAEGAAETARLMAPVNAQIALAEKIAQEPSYQQYLQVIEAIKAYLEVGSKQAEALQKADIKVIANTGKPTEGVGNVMDMFTTKGGTNLAGMVEAFAQTPMGQMVLAKVGLAEGPAAPAPKNGNGAAMPEAE